MGERRLGKSLTVWFDLILAILTKNQHASTPPSEYSTFTLSGGRPALTLRTIGGIIDLHFFLGPTLEDVNKQYAQVGIHGWS